MTSAIAAANAAIDQAKKEGAARFAEAMEATLRIHAAKETAERVCAAIKAADDLPFWSRRIIRAIKRGERQADNRLSLRGSTSEYYTKALERLLVSISGEPVRVYAGYSDRPPPGCWAKLYVVVSW